MTVVPYRAVITAPILDPIHPFFHREKKMPSLIAFFFSFFFLISTATPIPSTVSRIFKKESKKEGTR